MITNKFGKLIDGNISFAPLTIRVENYWLCNPQREDYLNNGWYEIVDEVPICEEGYYAISNGWELDNNVIKRVYKIEAIPPQTKRYSKLKIIESCIQLGIWDKLKAWITNRGYIDLWNAAQNLSNDYQNWDNIINVIIESGIATQSEIDTILTYAEQ